MELRTIQATRYVTPLREGGSMPAVVEADDDGLYVLKFRGAAQGAKTLIAEIIVGEIARSLDLRIPEIVFMELDIALGRTEPDAEIQDLIKASVGRNLALDFLPAALTFDSLIPASIVHKPELAAAIVWLDAFATNVDRTPRNPNLLVWHREPWLIDHGAALYFHHAWTDYRTRSQSPFPQVKDHVLLPFAGSISEADARLASRLTETRLREIVALIPDEWLGDVPIFPDVAAHRAAYLDYLMLRLDSPRAFVQEAENARTRL